MDVQMPDGTIISGVPEGYTKEQVLAKYQGYSPKEAPLLDSNAVPRGLIKGAAGLADFALKDIPGYLTQATGWLSGNDALKQTGKDIQDTPFAQDFVNSALAKYDPGATAPRSALTKGIEGASEFVGGNLALGPLGAAKNAVQARALVGSTLGYGAASSGTDDPLLKALAAIGGGIVATPKETVSALASLFPKVNAPNALKNLTQSGREVSVGNKINSLATDPEQALRNIQSAPDYIPGSVPTTGVASGDYGLIAAEKGLRNSNSADFAPINSAQNLARIKALDEVAQSPMELNQAVQSRNASAKDLYSKAYNSGAVNSDRIQEFLATPEVKAGISRGLKIQRLEAVAEGKKFDPKDYAVTGFNEAGDPILGKVPNMRLLDAGKRGLDAMISDNTDAVTGRVNEMGRALTMFKNSYLKELDSLNAPYKEARGQFAELSKPINQLEELQNIRARSITSGEDVNTGVNFLSQPKFFNNFTKQRDELAKTLSTAQLNRMDNIAADLNRGFAINDPNIRAIGSPTMQYASIAESIGQQLGNKVLPGFISTPLSWVNQLGQKQVDELFLNAMKDKNLAAQLMMKPTESNVKSASKALKARANRLGLLKNVTRSAIISESSESKE